MVAFVIFVFYLKKINCLHSVILVFFFKLILVLLATLSVQKFASPEITFL